MENAKSVEIPPLSKKKTVQAKPMNALKRLLHNAGDKKHGPKYTHSKSSKEFAADKSNAFK